MERDEAEIVLVWGEGGLDGGEAHLFDFLIWSSSFRPSGRNMNGLGDVFIFLKPIRFQASQSS